jgi:two-component system response regulator AtoC
MIFAETDTLGPADLAIPARGPAAAGAPPPAPRSLDSLEREAILAALRRWEGNRSRSAEELGISRRTLLNKIKEYGIEL